MVCLVALGLRLSLTLISSQIMADERIGAAQEQEENLAQKNEAVGE